jgi:hypothetical protein
MILRNLESVKAALRPIVGFESTVEISSRALDRQISAMAGLLDPFTLGGQTLSEPLRKAIQLRRPFHPTHSCARAVLPANILSAQAPIELGDNNASET